MTTEQVTPSHGTNKDPWADKVRIILSLAGLAYLTAIPFFSSMGKPGMPEAVVFATIVLLNSKVFANLAELSISSKGIGFKVQQVEQKQIDQADQIKALYWLSASVATDLELDYLERIAGNGPAQFDNGVE